MRSKSVAVATLSVAALGLLVWSVNADVRGEKAGKQVVVTGRVVDLHCFMTGEMPSSDPVRCTTDCIRAGVPAGLETDTGLIMLGQGANGPAKTLLPFAYAEVEVAGKLFERHGLRYLDIASIQPVNGDEEGDYEPEGQDDED